MRINEQLVKDKSADRTKNREMIRVAPLKIKINRHKEQLEAAVTDLNSTDMFLGHDWLVMILNPEGGIKEQLLY